MGALTCLLGRGFALHQAVNPQQWIVNGVQCAGTGGQIKRELDIIKGGFGEKISGPLLIPKSQLSFVPLDGMAVTDLSDGTVYKIANVGKTAWAWKLTLEANRNKGAKPAPI